MVYFSFGLFIIALAGDSRRCTADFGHGVENYEAVEKAVADVLQTPSGI